MSLDLDLVEPTLDRLAAFTTTPEGGNPAGVWIGWTLPSPEHMQRIALEVGFSETAFLARTEHRDEWITRYYSPEREIDFCGHATIAAATVLGRRYGDQTYRLQTAVGEVPVEVRSDSKQVLATLTSVEPRRRDIPAGLLASVLDGFGWSSTDLDPALEPDLAFAGAWHLVLPLARRATLSALSYEFDTVKALMLEHDITTIQVVWRETAHRFHARDPFPVGGVVEDPATGAAAAALGGYLRHHGYVDTPTDIVITQGVDMGRPSLIEVHIPKAGGIHVTGTAVSI